MKMLRCYCCAFKRSFDCKGRSGRVEYFVLVIGNFLIPSLLYLLVYTIFSLFFLLSCLLPSVFTDIMTNVMVSLPYFINYFLLLLTFILLVPIFSVGIRRFHDVGINGIWSIIGSSSIAILMLVRNDYVAAWAFDLVWYLVSDFTVIFLFTVLIIFFIICCLPGKKYINKYGHVYSCDNLTTNIDEFF